MILQARHLQALKAAFVLIGLLAAHPAASPAAETPLSPDFAVTDLGAAKWASLNDKGGVCLLTDDVAHWYLAKTVCVLWRNGQRTILPPIPGSRAADGCRLTGDGAVVAYSGNGGFSYQDGTWKAVPRGRSGYGAIVGYRSSSIEAVNVRSHVAGTLGDLSQDVFGVDDGPLHPHAFFYSAGMFRDLGTLGGSVSCATGLSENDAVIGKSQRAVPRGAKITDPGLLLFHAFLWKAGVMHDLGDLPGDVASNASAINDFEQVVGACDVESADRLGAVKDATLWQDGTPQNLNYRVALPRDWHLDDAVAVNNRGQILASGHYKDETHFFLLTPAP